KQELDRRLVAARASDPTRKREQSLDRESTHVGKAIERLLNAYQEGLLSIEQLRERMPALRQRQQTLRAELQAIADQTRAVCNDLLNRAASLAFAGRFSRGYSPKPLLSRRDSDNRSLNEVYWFIVCILVKDRSVKTLKLSVAESCK